LESYELSKTAIIHHEFKELIPEQTASDSISGTVQLTSYRPNELIYHADLNQEGIVVFSQVWYTAGWKAYVNGQEQPLIRADYILRALVLPEGQSEIVMKFESKVWKIGQKVSLASSSLLFLLIIAWALTVWRRKNRVDQA